MGPVYTKPPLRHFNYHNIGKTNIYYSNPNYYDLKNNNNSNNCNGLKKATNLGPSKGNHSPSRNVPISKQHDLNKSVKGYTKPHTSRIPEKVILEKHSPSRNVPIDNQYDLNK